MTTKLKMAIDKNIVSMIFTSFVKGNTKLSKIKFGEDVKKLKKIPKSVKKDLVSAIIFLELDFMHYDMHVKKQYSLTSNFSMFFEFNEKVYEVIIPDDQELKDDVFYIMSLVEKFIE